MENRSSQRRITRIPIVCSRFSSFCSGEPIEGVILNSCRDGFYAELKVHKQAGTIIVVRMTGCFSESSMGCGVHCLSLAEVKWSKPILVDKEMCYATGLQYVMDY
jgi:hypothetical protein